MQSISKFLGSSRLTKAILHSRGFRMMVAIDFDHTIIEQDSVVAVSQLLSDKNRTKELRSLIPECGWLPFTRRVLQLLHEEQGLGAAEVGNHVRQLTPVPGMLRLMRSLARKWSEQADLVIISDANCFFISQWLESHGIEHLFAGIHTNPSSVQEDGQLTVTPYEEQKDCDQCPSNLCKGGVLRKLAKEGEYQRIVYMGDGCNDLCAIRKLQETDIACIRRGHELYDKLPAHRDELQCEILTWRTGHELQEQLRAKNLS